MPLTFLIHIADMDDACCAQRVAVALRSVETIDSIHTSDRVACVTAKGPLDAARITAVLSAAGYAAGAIEPASACPVGSVAPSRDPWAGIDDFDARVVSHGEPVDLDAQAAAGKFTVYDFGAAWCAPCHTTAAALQAYLGKHSDVAVRAIQLDGVDAKASFALPVVKQHMQWAEGLPYLLVRAADGKTIYTGSDVALALAAIDKQRK